MLISEIENAFFNYAADAGVSFTKRPLIADGRLHREHVDGDKRGTKNGAYVLHADGKPSGWFLHYKTGISGKWTLSGKREPMTKVMREQIEADRQRRMIELQQRHNETARKSAYVWSKALPAPSDHPYLIKKHIKPHGARLGCDNTLIVPLHNANKEIVNLQFISETGTKRFLSGGKKKGCFYWLGEPTNKILLCEGFATGASLHEDSGYLVVIAFDAGNLKDVAMVIKSLCPDAEIIICADNDISGVGKQKAREAAMAINCKYIIPPTSGDFNDHLAGSV